jgi:hypothetical protein
MQWNDTIGNRTCDILACSTVLQPNVPPRAPGNNLTIGNCTCYLVLSGMPCPLAIPSNNWLIYCWVIHLYQLHLLHDFRKIGSISCSAQSREGHCLDTKSGFKPAQNREPSKAGQLCLRGLLNSNQQCKMVNCIVCKHLERKNPPITFMRRLTTGIRSEKCVVRRFRRCESVIECTYTNLDKAYCTPRLYVAYCSWVTNLYSMVLRSIL